MEVNESRAVTAPEPEDALAPATGSAVVTPIVVPNTVWSAR